MTGPSLTKALSTQKIIHIEQGAILISQKQNGVTVSCLFTILLFLISLSVAMAEEKSPEREAIQEKAPEKVISYTKYGVVQRVGDGEIVVNDHLLKLAGNVVYHTPEMGALASKNIKAGTQIGFNMNKKQEVTDIWIIKNP